MKSFLLFLGGLIAGAILTVFFLYIMAVGSSSKDYHLESQVQYVEVKGRKGNVTLHTGMSKDSVKLLLGKPDQIDLDKIQNIHFEKWGYKLKNNYISDLDIDFKDGKLKGIWQK